ncbi:MAG: superoxide dismutase [Nanoarchaeota archaeon]
MQKHVLPKLPYAFDALEPYMDARTVEIHYGKHHQTYCDKLNLALEKHPSLFDKSVEELLSDLNAVPEDIRTAVRNFGGGFVNHNIFWEVMCPTSQSGKCSGELLRAIEKEFGSFDEFKKKFTDKAVGLFGSGYCWLVLNGEKLETAKTSGFRGAQEQKVLDIMITKDQDSPLSVGKTPILVIDVWEHSYYLKYQNRRAEFVEAWWNLVNWKKIEKLFLS